MHPVPQEGVILKYIQKCKVLFLVYKLDWRKWDSNFYHLIFCNMINILHFHNCFIHIKHNIQIYFNVPTYYII